MSILPDILGFSLGGYVIMVGFGDTEFIEALRGRESKESGPSIYMKINATFVHFIVVQAITLFMALASSAMGISAHPLVSLVGTFFLFYAIVTILAATFGVLTFANWYDQKPKD
ncbi:hypothetical protein GO013_15740 [Pseudodesulfovibrio sp. JC047]|uniref:hypothetical protein n=1 Tax=Pseudodesulfovibrio sp. JC047 TaxID=2683199 RepID=UPI0013D81657|nr:hypothetical protein [Pseudodesulfovibrio sp. JC047]NDV20863.1 hypothetical protein [Pseudodesulfovibrio sp. JC047]